MFESITLTAANKNNNLFDIGLLIECMLFYKKVIVIASYSILDQLYQYFGPELLLTLLEQDYLQIIYIEIPAGIVTRKEDDIEYYGAVQLKRIHYGFQDDMEEICIGVSGKKGASRRLARRFEKCITISKDTPLILKDTNESIMDQKYIEKSANIIINQLVDGLDLSNNFEFKTFYVQDKGITIKTNINFNKINSVYSLELTIASIFIHILTLHEALYFASCNISELACSNLTALLGMNKVNLLLGSEQNSQRLNNYKEFIFDDVKAIRESVNAGHIDLANLPRILKKSRQFKEWIGKVLPNEDLCKAYHKEIVKDTLFERLPGKLLKYTAFLGIEKICPGSEKILSILDTFFFDKLAIGWKPTYYIDDIKNFIKQ